MAMPLFLISDTTFYKGLEQFANLYVQPKPFNVQSNFTAAVKFAATFLFWVIIFLHS
jgi:hypothetical protein